VAVGRPGVVGHLTAWPSRRGGPTVQSVWRGAVTVAVAGMAAELTMARQSTRCCGRGDASMSEERGARWARRRREVLT
jgi:hypothetical protein